MFIIHFYFFVRRWARGCLIVVLTLGVMPLAHAEAALKREPLMLDVYKSPNCSCCKQWVAYMNERGFMVQTHNTHHLDALKQSKGIGPAYQSCHTGISADGYVFEGHIPAQFVKAFLAAPPEDALGLSVPAMPVGSPGMEYQDMFRPYDILLLKQDGSTVLYGRVNSLEASLE
ncbi:DUF411 domain-containing protein [Shewanella surugensis]|uniref:DUF411 domain-containing protein n=1 Tax=Shewanella surugensis TaxID=212020 RepID=A0ABT0L9B6_9GAMM|nr:DUF411 domain-containing protein [Shewanella surugensis]MCL1124297.1 DUF411 domain-containing protein [Shewanella surugensis]